MTTPQLATTVKGLGRHYPYPPNSDQPEMFPSVSNVKGILDGGPGLKGWYAEQALYEVIERRSMPPFGASEDEVYEWVRYHKWAMNRRGKKRMAVGTDAHTLAEALTTDAPIPAGLRDADSTYGDALLAFLTDHHVDTQHVERTVFHPEHKYAGTFDAAGILDGIPTLWDFKTRDLDRDGEHKPAWWPEDRLQLAALAYAPEMWDDDRIVAAPLYEQVAIVALYPDGQCEVHTWGISEVAEQFDCFCALRRAWNIVKGAAA